VRPFRSLRVRLTLWSTGILAVFLGLYGAAVFLILKQHAYSTLDRRLHEDVEVALRDIDITEKGRLTWRQGEHFGVAEDEPGTGRWLEVWGPDGELALKNSSPRPLVLGPPPGRDRAGWSARTVAPVEGVWVRTLTLPATLAGVPVALRAARSEEPLRHQLGELMLYLALVFPFVVGLAGCAGYGLARRHLAPLALMAERARRITAEHLEERLPVGNVHDELGQLAAAFNDAFGRLERSFEQLRRFTADASHELRTPLTAIRSVGEVGLRGDRDTPGYREVIGSMLEEADRLTSLVDTLLTLSRADAGELRLSPEFFDAAELLRDVANQLSVLAEERDQSLSVETRRRIEVQLDRRILKQALVNLVDNAIKYSPRESEIQLRAVETDGLVAFEVADQGLGIPAEHREKIFDRFYRVDTARSRTLGGAGLGLSLATWAAESQGGRIEVESEEGTGSTFRIVIPKVRAAAG